MTAATTQFRPYTRRKDIKDNSVIVFKAAELSQIDQDGFLSR